MTKLKSECKELTKANQRLTKVRYLQYIEWHIHASSLFRFAKIKKSLINMKSTCIYKHFVCLLTSVNLFCPFRTHLEHSLSAVEKEKESLTMETQSLKDKLKQFKNRHKTKGTYLSMFYYHNNHIHVHVYIHIVKELTEDLNRLSKERDTFRRDLLEVQSSHIATQSLIERHSSSRPTTAAHHSSTAITIPLEEHKKTLQEFERYMCNIEDVH